MILIKLQFCRLPLNKELLSRLKLLVTVDPTKGVMTVPTGVPPHINQNSDIQELLEIITVVKHNQENQVEEIKKCIHNAFEDHALENRNPTNASIQALLNDIQKRDSSNLDDCFDQLYEQIQGSTMVVNNITTAAPSQQQHQGSEQLLFSYNGHFYYVPGGFLFPASATLKSELEF